MPLVNQGLDRLYRLDGLKHVCQVVLLFYLATFCMINPHLTIRKQSVPVYQVPLEYFFFQVRIVGAIWNNKKLT